MSSTKQVEITPERKNTIFRKILRIFHYRAFRTTFKNTFHVPMTDLYHPSFRKHSHYPSVSARYRGLLALSIEACTGCKKCERACPNNTIIMHERLVNGKVHRFPGYYSARCMFCGLCSEACDRQFAIRHTDQFEEVGYIREQVYYPPERMFALWDRHIQPKIDAGMTHASTPDKRRADEDGKIMHPEPPTKKAKEEPKTE
ncbi:MAG: 4Fe-4S dicluster domain-containing protein [Candidatus Heimdallarchaeota archaeon]|nr:4Fe-4S dicluster domain-containing protein [Candidatus Heimdallarchaeota archaeon]